MGNKKSTPRKYLSEKDLIFLEANTKFNREKIIEWHNAFLADCPSGKYIDYINLNRANEFLVN